MRQPAPSIRVAISNGWGCSSPSWWFVGLVAMMLGLATPAGRATAAGEIHVRTNQLGHAPRGTKLGMAFSATPLPATFALVDERTGDRVFEGPTRVLESRRWGRFDHHAELDFSSFDRTGRYRLRVATDESLPFAIGDEVDRSWLDAPLEFLRQQRCGYNPWLKETCHAEDGRTAYGPLAPGTPIDVTGGWHDAADLLKYHITSGNATAQLLLAYQLARSAGLELADRVDARGDPTPNGVADLLDEARWGLDWLLKMHPDPKSLYHQVADDRDHIALRLPHHETADYGWGPGKARVVYFADGRPQGLGRYPSQATGVANLAGRYAAAMGLAYQVERDLPGRRAFADRCLKAGREVYDMGRAQEGYQQGNSVRAPYRYEESTWADDMEWGAAELHRATGEPCYLADAARYARLAFGGGDSWMGRDEARHYYYYPFMNLGHYRLHDLADAGLRRALADDYRAGIERCIQAGASNPYDIGVPFLWCSNNLAVALVTQCGLYERMTGDRRFAAFAARNRDWLFGRNPWGTTMITGVGQVFPRNVHLQTTKLTGRSVRGGLVDGPIREATFRSLRGVSITEPDPLAPFQDARAVYHDDFADYSTNEPTMDGSASALLMGVVFAEPVARTGRP